VKTRPGMYKPTWAKTKGYYNPEFAKQTENLLPCTKNFRFELSHAK